MNQGPPRSSLAARGLVFNSVALAITLVAVTAATVGLIVVWSLERQIEQSADVRLVIAAVSFQSILDDDRNDLTSAGSWLARDPRLLQGLRERRRDDLDELLGYALALHAVDGVVIADNNGVVVTAASRDGPARTAENVSQTSTSGPERAGKLGFGIARGPDGSIRQEVGLSIRDGGSVIAILTVYGRIDQSDLDQFRERTGIDASLFYGRERVATTLRRTDGRPLTDVELDPRQFDEVIGSGRETFAWRDLPIGRHRSYLVPIRDAGGTPVGVLSVAIPAETLVAELRDTLPTVLPWLALVTVVAGSFAYQLARRVRDPVLALAAAAARLRAGDLTTPIPPVAGIDLVPLAENLERFRTNVLENLEAAAAEETRQRALLSALDEPIITAGPDGRIVEANPTAEALLGSPLAGREIAGLLPLMDSPREETGDGARWTGLIDDVTGKTHDVEVTRTRLEASLLPAEDVYVLHDVSRYAELNRLREQLLYEVAHELRGPISVLDHALDILADEYSSLSAGEVEHVVASARRTARRLHTLMEDLLSAGAIQSGRLVLNPRPCSLVEIVKVAIESLGALGPAVAPRVEWRLPDGEVHVIADPRAIRQVLENLIANAAKYGPEDGTIHIAVQREDGLARIAIEDEGPGIAPEQQRGLFERFYRVRNGNQPGIGLGLAIVKGIIDGHGGTVGVESAEGAGTKVWFTLPLAETATR